MFIVASAVCCFAMLFILSSLLVQSSHKINVQLSVLYKIAQKYFIAARNKADPPLVTRPPISNPESYWPLLSKLKPITTPNNVSI